MEEYYYYREFSFTNKAQPGLGDGSVKALL